MCVCRIYIYINTFVFKQFIDIFLYIYTYLLYIFLEPAIRIVSREVGLPVGKLAALPVGKRKASAARRQAI